MYNRASQAFVKYSPSTGVREKKRLRQVAWPSPIKLPQFLRPVSFPLPLSRQILEYFTPLNKSPLSSCSKLVFEEKSKYARLLWFLAFASFYGNFIEFNRIANVVFCIWIFKAPLVYDRANIISEILQVSEIQVALINIVPKISITTVTSWLTKQMEFYEWRVFRLIYLTENDEIAEEESTIYGLWLFNLLILLFDKLFGKRI